MNDGSMTNGETLTLTTVHAEWTKEHEKILVEWADKAMCYRWLHSKAHAMYNTQNAWYTIPVIVISTLTGTANFAQERVPADYQYIFTMIVGGFNILAGIITTIQQFLKITQLNESHRVSSIAWDKFYRNIKIELAKHPSERLNVAQMVKISKEEFDRLMETSPSVPDNIVRLFKASMKKNEAISVDGEVPAHIPKIIKPEICDELASTELSRNPWFSDENMQRAAKMLETMKRTKEQRVETFKRRFFELNHREPLPNEIEENMGIDLDIV